MEESIHIIHGSFPLLNCTYCKHLVAYNRFDVAKGSSGEEVCWCQAKMKVIDEPDGHIACQRFERDDGIDAKVITDPVSKDRRQDTARRCRRCPRFVSWDELALIDGIQTKVHIYGCSADPMIDIVHPDVKRVCTDWEDEEKEWEVGFSASITIRVDARSRDEAIERAGSMLDPLDVEFDLDSVREVDR